MTTLICNINTDDDIWINYKDLLKRTRLSIKVTDLTTYLTKVKLLNFINEIELESMPFKEHYLEEFENYLKYIQRALKSNIFDNENDKSHSIEIGGNRTIRIRLITEPTYDIEL